MEYRRVKTIQEAISFLSEYEGKAKIIAGGTDLMVDIKNRSVKPECLVDIEGIPGLNYINYSMNKGFEIGALTPIKSLEVSPEIRSSHPIIQQAAKQLGSIAIRNVATIGGNLCNAAPSAETAPCLIGLSARVSAIGLHGERELELEKFFTGPGCTVLEPEEVLTTVRIPLHPSSMRGVYLKHSIREVDLSIVSIAVIVSFAADMQTCNDVRIVLGAVAPTPMRAKRAEDLLRGKPLHESLIEKCAQTASDESRPITDVRGSADYRREMVKVFTRRAIKQLL